MKTKQKSLNNGHCAWNPSVSEVLLLCFLRDLILVQSQTRAWGTLPSFKWRFRWNEEAHLNANELPKNACTSISGAQSILINNGKKGRQDCVHFYISIWSHTLPFQTLLTDQEQVERQRDVTPPSTLLKRSIFRHSYLADAGNNRECRKLLQNRGFQLTLAAKILLPRWKDNSSRKQHPVYLVIWSLNQILCSTETSRDNAFLTRNHFNNEK